MKNKIFILMFVYIVFLIFIITILSNIFVNNNQWLQSDTHLIRVFQINKIRNCLQKDNINTIVVGDSSAGNGISAEYFSQLSSRSTLNLSLVGTYGIEGSINIILRAREEFPNLKNILIIHTLDIWPRPFSYQSYFLTLPSFGSVYQDHVYHQNIYKAYFDYVTNPKTILMSIKDQIKKIMGRKIDTELDYKNDYLMQRTSKYSNNQLRLNGAETIPSPFENSDQQSNYIRLNAICKEMNLNCLFLNGPIHRQIYENSLTHIDRINNFTSGYATSVRAFSRVFYYEKEKMGDSSDHVDNQFKNDSTLQYYLEVKNYLQ